LKHGDSLIIFPEGTRGPGDRLLPLKPGIFHLAKWFRDVELVPVWIDNSHRILPKGFAIPVPLLCSVTFGSPLRWREDEEQQAFLERVKDAMESLRTVD
jgi:1-acyl-sn-glycerol-3-phosphate acyltransferase